MMIYFLYATIGIFSGFLSGLLGIGGGVIVVPALLFIFKYTQIFPENIIMHIAVGTSLASMIFATLSSSYAYFKRKLILWPLVKAFTPGACFGILCGVITSHHINSQILIQAFSVFLFGLSIYLFLQKKIVSIEPITEIKPCTPVLIIVSILIGLIASFFGIGGGILMVPFFLSLGVNLRQAYGSSVTCGLPIAILCTILFIIFNPKNMQYPGVLGFVYWHAALIIAGSGMISAQFGVYCGTYINPTWLKRFFALLLASVAINLFIT